MRASKTRTFLSRKTMQALLDGDNNTCVVATPRNFRESTVIIRVDLGSQCLKNIIAHVVMANASSLYPTLYLRQICLTTTKTKPCKIIRYDSRRSAVYECPDDPSRLVTIVVPANHSICEIAMSYAKGTKVCTKIENKRVDSFDLWVYSHIVGKHYCSLVYS